MSDDELQAALAEVERLRAENTEMGRELERLHRVQGAITGDATVECRVTFHGWQALATSTLDYLAWREMSSVERHRQLCEMAEYCIRDAVHWIHKQEKERCDEPRQPGARSGRQAGETVDRGVNEARRAGSEEGGDG